MIITMKFFKLKVTLMSSQIFIKEKAEEILKENRSNRAISTAIISYRNFLFQKGVNNLFTPDFVYDITTDNFLFLIKYLIPSLEVIDA